jgi:predicted aspartyl protease
VWNVGGEADKLAQNPIRRNNMVIGRIGADLRPMVPVVVQGANGQERKIPVLLSTGFGEALLLPPAEVAALGLAQTGERTVEFPDGSRIEATVHPARILLAGEAQDVDVLAGGWEPRMGLRLLQGYRISMRFVEGAAVEVERSVKG